tara:strand:+ start:3133 stop:3321 length:189 start_codon:yes stop_codon:yes gene_type:complete
MGKVKEACQDFLEEGGFALGYSMDFLPDIADFKYVLSNSVDAQAYTIKKQSRQNIKEAYDIK